MNPEFWTVLSSISTAIASVVVIITLILSYRGLKETVRSRSLDALRETFQNLTAEDMSVSRRYVLTKDLPMPGKVSAEAYEHMHKVWVAYDNLGIMIHNKLLPREIALSMFHDSIIKCWQKLEPYIQYEEFKRKTYYQIYFKELYKASCQYAASLAKQKKATFEKAQQGMKLGKARAAGLELQGIYNTLGLKKQSQSIQSQLNQLHQTVFLDRDGTLNVDDIITYREKQFQLIEGVREGLLQLKIWGFDLIVVSNQAGINRGKYSEQQMRQFNELIIKALDPLDVKQEDFYFCPHDPEKEECECRKPNPGMLSRAAEDRSINLSQSYIIGDKMSDILAGKRAGCKKTILVKTGITDDVDKYDVAPDYVVENLVEAARVIAEVEGIEI